MIPVLVVEAPGGGLGHDTGFGHPERQDRIPAVRAGIDASELGEAVTTAVGRPAAVEEVLAVHTPGYVESIRRLAASGGGDLDPDTTLSAGSWKAALESAGAGLTAIEALIGGDAASAFVTTRPPGHHALRETGMGFCVFNNIAIAAASLTARGERVAIVDWDVHHGNGTEAIFWNDPRVLFVSVHQAPFYPGTGSITDVGGAGAFGLTVNVPLPAGATGDVVRRAFDEIAAPAVDGFAPTWVLVSAGYDAHRLDPLAGLMWTSADFADLARTVVEWAPQPGRLVAFLEGGYDLTALAASTGATVAAFAGVRWAPEPPSSGGPGGDAVDAALEARRRLVTG